MNSYTKKKMFARVWTFKYVTGNKKCISVVVKDAASIYVAVASAITTEWQAKVAATRA